MKFRELKSHHGKKKFKIYAYSYGPSSDDNYTQEARKNVEVDELSDTEIDPHIMTDFYSAMFNTA